jgi:hypothetical protein
MQLAEVANCKHAQPLDFTRKEDTRGRLVGQCRSCRRQQEK